MKVRAPFHVGEEWGGDWILFGFRAEFSQLDRVQWDYWRSQRLASQGDRLRLQMEARPGRKNRRNRLAPTGTRLEREKGGL
jgi:hypothetical protein